MKKVFLALLFVALPLCVMAEQQADTPLPAPLRISISESDVGDSHLVIPQAQLEGEPASEETEQEAAVAQVGEINARIAERFRVDEAMQVSRRAGARFTQTADVYQDEQIASIGVIWQGTQADGLDGCSAYAITIDLSTGEEITFEQLFDDADAAVRAMEAIIEEEVIPGLSDYMIYADLLPMPQDCFSVSDRGLTVYYQDEQYSLFSGVSGTVMFYWYELEDLIGENSPVYALSRPQQADAAAIRQTEGSFGVLAGLGELLGTALDAYALAEPEYTKNSLVYMAEDASLRGYALEIPKYAETQEEDTPISAVRASCISWYGLTTGRTAREEITALLGEPDATQTYDAGDADDMLLTPGESLLYQLEQAVLEAHLDESGILDCLILRTDMPENRLY